MPDDQERPYHPTAIRMPTDLRRDLEAAAKREDRTLTRQIIHYVRRGIRQDLRDLERHSKKF